MTDEPAEPSPLLRIVKGDPTPEEVAALVAVVSALRLGRHGQASDAPREWAAPRGMRRPLRHGPGAWRASGLG